MYNCMNECNISFEGVYNIGVSLWLGGISGCSSYGNITNCINRGEISGNDNMCQYKNVSAGGISGIAERTTIYNCVNSGDIQLCHGYHTVGGGIAGSIRINGKKENVEIQNCYNTAEIDATVTGGIIGDVLAQKDANNKFFTQPNNEIKNTYNIGRLSGTFSGGIIGAIDVRGISTEDVNERIHGENDYFINSAALNRIGGFYCGYDDGAKYYPEGYYTIIYQELYIPVDSINYLGIHEEKIIISSGAKSEANMKKPEFAQKLGYAFAYVEGDYPKLAWELGITYGDVNLDGEVNLADAVKLQKYLLCDAELDETAAVNADLSFDKKLNAVDLTLLKRMLINSYY